jgi:hypothetical protein
VLVVPWRPTTPRARCPLCGRSVGVIRAVWHRPQVSSLTHRMLGGLAPPEAGGDRVAHGWLMSATPAQAVWMGGDRAATLLGVNQSVGGTEQWRGRRSLSARRSWLAEAQGPAYGVRRMAVTWTGRPARSADGCASHPSACGAWPRRRGVDRSHVLDASVRAPAGTDASNCCRPIRPRRHRRCVPARLARWVHTAAAERISPDTGE